MLGIVWSDHALPHYHDDTLICRIHPHAADMVARVDLAHPAARHEAPGLHLLARHERNGMLRHVHAMDASAGARARHRGEVVDGVSAAARHHDARHAHTGALMVQLHHARHLDRVHETLTNDPHVEWVERVPARFFWAARKSSGTSKVPGDADLSAIRMWHHDAIRLEAAHETGAARNVRRITVAVLDSGVDTGHPGLRGRVHRYVHRYGSRQTSADDILGHGTHVSGIITAIPREMGIGGICACRLTMYKVFDADTFLVPGPPAPARLYLVNPIFYRAALAACLRERYDVINLSVGGPAAPDPHEAALFKGIVKGGSVIVAAMGNSMSHQRRLSYPAAVPGVIAVGALGPDGLIADFSCRGPHIAVCAPGLQIWSTLPRNDGEFGFTATPSGRRSTARDNPERRNTIYDAWPGTSMACPQVAGAVAMLIAAKGRMSPAQVKRRLIRTAEKLPAMRGRAFTSTYGGGRLDIKRLISD